MIRLTRLDRYSTEKIPVKLWTEGSKAPTCTGKQIEKRVLTELKNKGLNFFTVEYVSHEIKPIFDRDRHKAVQTIVKVYSDPIPDFGEFFTPYLLSAFRTLPPCFPDFNFLDPEYSFAGFPSEWQDKDVPIIPTHFNDLQDLILWLAENFVVTVLSKL